jgi:hypothetical protein
MHVEEQKLEGLLSGELSEGEKAVVREHLAQCEACASAFEAAQREDIEIARLLESLDHRVPDVDPGQLARRASRRVPRPQLVAAGIALLIAAGAATAMPGSPVRSWLSRVIDGLGGTGTALPGQEQVGATEQPPAGVSVVPTAEFALAFEAVQETGRIRITLESQPEVAVRSDSEGVGFSVEPLGVRVLNAGSQANYEIVIPIDAESVVIRTGEKIVFQIQDGVVLIPAAAPAAGDYVVDFAALSL